jgi:hypothetical protein
MYFSNTPPPQVCEIKVSFPQSKTLSSACRNVFFGNPQEKIVYIPECIADTFDEATNTYKNVKINIDAFATYSQPNPTLSGTVTGIVKPI